MTFKTKYFLILLLIPLVVAQLILIEIMPQRTELSPGEVYQTEITLNNPITDLKKTNIKLYSPEDTVVPVSPFLDELGDNHYFLYFEVPYGLDDGTYQLRIKDQSFLVNGALQQFEGIENITLTTSQPSVAVTPGYFLLPTGETGKISITTESKDIPTNIFFLTPEYITHPYITEQSINPKVPRIFTFDYDTSNATSSELVVNSGSKQYKIPILIEGQIEENNQENTTQNQQTDPITFFVDNNHLEKTIKSDQIIEGNLHMHNNLNTSIMDITSELTGNLRNVITINPIQDIRASSNFTTFMIINPTKNTKAGTYSGNLVLSNELYVSTLQITITVEEAETIRDVIIDEPEITTTSNETTAQIEQFVPWNLSSGYEEESKVAASPFIYLIVILLAIAVIIFLLSGKKTTKKKSFSEMVSENQKK